MRRHKFRERIAKGSIAIPPRRQFSSPTPLHLVIPSNRNSCPLALGANSFLPRQRTLSLSLSFLFVYFFCCPQACAVYAALRLLRERTRLESNGRIRNEAQPERGASQ